MSSPVQNGTGNANKISILQGTGCVPKDLCDADLPTFDTASSDLGRVLPAKRNHEYLYRMHCNGFALRNRFDGLHLHRTCYYHSHDSAEVAICNLSAELGAQSSSMSRASRGETDCIGMTPLHILACSTKHHMALYELILRRYPDHLIVEDVWGEIPLLYALWGRAPRNIVEFLATSMKEYHPTYNINWEKMVGTLCTGLAPIASVEYLIEMNRSLFPTFQLLQDIDWNSMVKVLCIEAKASEEHVTSFVTQYRDVLEELEQVSLQLAREVKFGFKRWWMRIGISNRLVLIGREKAEWQQEIESLILKCPTGMSESRDMKKRLILMKTILRKLVMYETVAQMWVLELALWKAKIEESQNPEDRRCKSYRSRCQYTSGADVIIPNVMAYLYYFRSALMINQ